MKFTAKEDFKHGVTTLEEGNSYDSVKQGITDDELDVFHRAGWVDIDGKDSVERNPSKSITLKAGTLKVSPRVRGV